LTQDNENDNDNGGVGNGNGNGDDNDSNGNGNGNEQGLSHTGVTREYEPAGPAAAQRQQQW
jgi:hypothetical protein